MKPVRLHDEVEGDVDEVWNHLAEASPETADRFVDAVEVTFAQIGRQPGIGHRRRWRSRKLANLRLWRVEGFPNHLVIYREEAEVVAIVAVISGYRRQERVLNKR
ncbi:MAG: type II toxin-antitoxin system RelE/ParE family toxin [Verrucomicrobia bacterium]|nr:type II toxin-antitoxin system RelE/ParE family toxin [Verrucomicrobiota bacterium]